MKTEVHTLLTDQADRRVARNSAPTFGDYWQTYVAAILSYGLLWQGAYVGSPRQATIILAILFVALAAARDSRRSVNRRIDAVVRQLEQKGML